MHICARPQPFLAARLLTVTFAGIDPSGVGGFAEWNGASFDCPLQKLHGGEVHWIAKFAIHLRRRCRQPDGERD
jgi:hypothetical protein